MRSLRSFLQKQSGFYTLLMLVVITAACSPIVSSELSSPSPFVTDINIRMETPIFSPTPRPSPTPTLPPLGNPGNPITLGFILLPENIAGEEAAEDIAFLVSNDSGLAIESVLYPDFLSLSTAVLNGEVDLFWLEPLQYIYLNWEGAADVLLLTNHLGVYAYGVQFLAHEARGFTSYYDPAMNESFGDPLAALQQFSGTRPCLMQPNSLPGSLVPLGLLADTSTPTLDPVYVFDYSAVIRALYIREICDFGVGYALIGDPRTAGDIMIDIPDAQSVVDVIWQSEGLIPNINLSASPSLPLHMQVLLQESFLDVADNPEGLPLLTTALGTTIEALKTVKDPIYNPLRAALIPLELDLQAITTQSPQ